MSRGLQHLVTANGLAGSPDPLVAFSAALAAERAMIAFTEVLPPRGTPWRRDALRAMVAFTEILPPGGTRRDALDLGACGGWADAAKLRATVANRIGRPTSATFRALATATASNDVPTCRPTPMRPRAQRGHR